MAFNAKDFVANPTVDRLLVLRKEDLCVLGKMLQLSFKSSQKKIEIRNVIVQHFVDEDVFEESALKYIVWEKSDSVKLKEMELQMQFKLQELDFQRVKEKEERELKLKEKELELEQELKLKQMELANQAAQVTHVTNTFDVTKHIRFVPQFDEKEVDKYFMLFEKIAVNLQWPATQYTILLQSVLKGRASEVYTALPGPDSADYQKVKQAILKAYELVPEAYRQKFRGFKKDSSLTYVEFAKTKERMFDRWCSSAKTQSQFDKLRQLVLIEEFKDCVSLEIKTYINENKADSLENAAQLADDYSLYHKVSFGDKSSFQSSHKKPFVPFNNSTPVSKVSSTTPSHQPSQQSIASKTETRDSQSPNSVLSCNYCKKQGHVLSECYALKRKNKREGVLPNALTSLRFKPQSFSQEIKNLPEGSLSDSIMESFQPFISDGFVSLLGENCRSIPVRILRDTASAQSVILEGVLPLHEEDSDSKALISGIEGGIVSVSLHCINLNSDLVSGPVTVGVRSSLPFKDVQLLLGNDLAGDKVMVNPIVTDKPSLNGEEDPLVQEVPDLYPACAVTRAMANKVIPGQVSSSLDFDLSGTFMADPDHEIVESLSSQPSVLLDKGLKGLSRQQLVLAQESDPEISVLIEKSVTEEEAATFPVCYFKKHGVLMRKWRPPDVAADEEWAVKYQIVVPKACNRSEILSMSHETPLAGHLGVNKTYYRILNYFFWPNLRRDVTQFCRSCHTCQMVGKPNQKIPQAHLHPIPAFEEPFSRILIDCVGPLPKSKSGNEYLLTIMCMSTRFPEAIPLRNIKTKTIVKALIKFFTLVGLPKSIQSDQGSNFMSGIFQQVMYELDIHQYKSSAYHPESQGALERFHQTLKNMIRTYCFDTKRDWDEGVHFVLFAARESVQESLGFSPFELVFGHTVRGPLKLLQEKLLSEENTSLNLLQYVSDFRTRLTKACEVARNNLKSAQGKMKSRHDVKAKERSFKSGEKVLALLPIPGRPLQARYFGPYTIDHKVSDLNYVINTPDRRKSKQLCHINMLKEYIVRCDSDCKPVSVAVPVPHSAVNNISCDNIEKSDSDASKLKNSYILNNLDEKLSHLEMSQQEELKELISEFAHIFSDIPTQTDVLFHDVDVGNASPVKQHPYRLNPIKQEALRKEVQYLLENDFIEPSNSEWSSPCILVPKPDNTFRMCTDYRKVNSLTKTDSFPIPRIDDCIDKIGQAKFVTKFDLLKGFYQVPLTEKAKAISAFVTCDGLYSYKVMPFGMKNSPATFQRLINILTNDLDGVDAYIDDTVLHNSTWESHVQSMRRFFDRLSGAKLTVNLAKSEFCHAHVKFLGHIVGQGQVKPIDAKVQAISDFSVPKCKKDLMRYLGMAGYYRKFCSNFSVIAAPLTNLLSKNSAFCWDEKCQKAFEMVKTILKSAPVLTAPDFTRQFKLAVDASDVGIGSVIMQEDINGVDHPVCYYSKKFNCHQKNYSTIEKECLALILSLQHFEVYVSCAVLPIVVFTDHNPLTFIGKMRNKNQRLMRWSLMLQEYNLDIRHIKGRDNVIADALSRVE